MENIFKDVRFAIRSLLKSPGFTAIALAALVLGIGANTAIFTVVNAVLLRPLPFKDPERLVMVWEHSPRIGKPNVANPQNFKDWEQRNRSFEKMAAYIDAAANITGEGRPEEVYAAYVTRQFFPILDVQPMLGRNFLAEEDRTESGQVALLSYGLWQRRYGADPHIAGKKIQLQSQPTTIAGVMPPGFRFPAMKAELWILNPINGAAKRHGRFLSVIGRLKPGISLPQARSEMQSIAAQLAIEYPEFDRKWGADVVSMREQFAGNLRTPLLVLLGAVVLVLLIACANVANLLLMRSSGRQREIALRASLGATRGRLIQQMLIESGLLGLIGGAMGLLLAVWAKTGLLAMLPESMSVAKVNSVAIDDTVLAFCVAVSLITGILFGLVPALRASRPDLGAALKEGGRGSSGSLSRNRLRAALVAGEMALALMLLIGAGLLIKSLVRLENLSPGFQPERILTMRVNLTSLRGSKPERRAAAWQEVIDRVKQVPGVNSAASIAYPPLGPVLPATGFWVAGKPVPKPGDQPVTGVSVVTPGYFGTMSIPLIKGRMLTDRDRSNTPLVTVIGQALAKQFFPGADPIGQKLFVQWGRETPYQIVGVVGDVRHTGLEKDPMPTVYFADAQEPNGGGTLVIRTATEPMRLAHAIEAQIHSYDREQPIADVVPMDVFLSKAVARPRFQSVLLGVFAALALLLAAIGIFGVMSYSVAQRTSEIGIRVALGAQRSEILKLVVGQGAVLALIGIAAGLAGAFALTRVLQSLLFEVSPTDPVVFAGVPLLLGAVALLATYLPARRASKVDPIVALRYE
ncbi:MAG: ABC transporter permease [Bryobacteraceae bacterium]